MNLKRSFRIAMTCVPEIPGAFQIEAQARFQSLSYSVGLPDFEELIE